MKSLVIRRTPPPKVPPPQISLPLWIFSVAVLTPQSIEFGAEFGAAPLLRWADRRVAICGQVLILTIKKVGMDDTSIRW